MGECTAARHGSRYAYRAYGCRCADTVELMRARWRAREPRGHLPNHTHGVRVSVDGIDEAGVVLARMGEAARASKAERVIAVAELARAGLNDFQIAERLRVARRTVQRYHRRAAA